MATKAAATSAQRGASDQIAFIGLPKAILPIYLTTFIDMLAFTLLIPLLPAIAHRYGAQDWLVGMLLSVPAFCAAIAAPVWGKISDRLGRKFIILVAQAFILAGYLVLALADSFFWVFISRVISGVGAGDLGAAESYITDVTSEDQRDRAFTIHGAIFGSAFIFGPLAAGFLQRYGIQFPFFMAAGLAAINILGSALLLPGRTRVQHPETSVKKSLKAALRTPVRVVLIRQFLFMFAVIYLLADFALYLDRALHESITHVSWLLAGAGIVGGLTMLFIVVPLGRRIGDRLVGQIGFGLLFVCVRVDIFRAKRRLVLPGFDFVGGRRRYGGTDADEFALETGSERRARCIDGPERFRQQRRNDTCTGDCDRYSRFSGAAHRRASRDRRRRGRLFGQTACGCSSRRILKNDG